MDAVCGINVPGNLRASGLVEFNVEASLIRSALPTNINVARVHAVYPFLGTPVHIKLHPAASAIGTRMNRKDKRNETNENAKAHGNKCSCHLSGGNAPNHASKATTSCDNETTDPQCVEGL